MDGKSQTIEEAMNNTSIETIDESELEKNMSRNC